MYAAHNWRAVTGANWLPLHGSARGDRLASGASLSPGQSLVSAPSGKYELAFQKDGNLVVYNRDPAARDKALWDSGTDNGRGHSCTGVVTTMQADGNLVVYSSAKKACWASGTNGHAVGGFVVMQDDGNVVIYDRGSKPNPSGAGARWSTRTTGGHKPPSSNILKSIGKTITSVAKPLTSAVAPVSKAFNAAVKAVEKIPVLGPVIGVTLAVTPIGLAQQIASGARLDHAVLNSLKNEVKAAKDIAPYATMIVSLVPGVGTGIAAAIAAGAALAEGKSITAALEQAVRAAIPGGQLAQAGFDLATKVAKGENVGKAALETARAQLPLAAQKAFDLGLAVASGKKLQSALANAVTSLAPAELQSMLAVGQKALQAVPGLAQAATHIADGAAKQGFQLAAGVLAHAGVTETAVTAMRGKLTGAARDGFDAALKTQEAHVPWLKNVTSSSAMQAVAKTVASSMPAAVHAAQTAARAVPHEPTRAALAMATSCAGVGAQRATRAFVAANRLVEAHEHGRADLGQHVARLRVLQRSPRHAVDATKAIHVLDVVQRWRTGLHVAQSIGCCGESTIIGSCGETTIIGGVEMPASTIPLERLIAAGVLEGTY